VNSNPAAFLILFLFACAVLAYGISRGVDWVAEKLGLPPNDDDEPPTGAVGAAA
jgi:hypothetical protein